MKHAKILALFLACLALLAALSACSGGSGDTGATPTVSPSPTPVATMGGRDTYSMRTERVALHFPERNGFQLISSIRSVTYQSNTSLAEAAMRQLVSQSARLTADSALAPAVPKGIELEHVEESCGVVSAHFTGKKSAFTAQSLFLFRACVINTLTSLPGVQYANIYLNHQLLHVPGVTDGASGKITENLRGLWLQSLSLKEDDETILTGDNNRTARRNVILYFTDPTHTYLVPEVRIVQLNLDNPAASIVEELRKGPRDTDRYRSLLSEKTELSEVTLAENERLGGKVMTLSFKRAAHDDARNASLVYGSIVLSLSGSICNAVAYDFTDRSGQIDMPERVNKQPLQRRQFTGRIGEYVPLYFSNDRYAGLVKVERVLPQANVHDPRNRLSLLAAGLISSDPTRLKTVFPAKTEAGDIISIVSEGDQFQVNLSANLAGRLGSLSEDQETVFVYAIVNTLTDMYGYNRVRFFVEGRSVETLAGHLYLGQPLLRNPGIVEQSTRN